MKVKIFLAVGLLGAGVLFYACKGEMGPEGPRGDTGSANVIQYTFNAPSMIGYLNYEAYYEFKNLPDGVDPFNSLVMAYLKNNSTTDLTLPRFLSNNLTNNRGGFYSYAVVRGRDATGNLPPSATGVALFRSGTDGFTITPVADRLALRVVIIPSSVVRSGRFPADFFNSYDRVKQAFNLPD